MTSIENHARMVGEQLPADADVTLDELTARLDTLVTDFEVSIETARQSLVEAYQQQPDSDFEGPQSDFVAVDVDNLHVWYRDKHYIGVGPAYKVESDQLFYFSEGISPEDPPTVTKVTEIIDASQSGLVKLDVGVEIQSTALTGKIFQMGQRPPPSLIVDPVKVTSLDDDVIETYLHKIGGGDPVDRDTLIQAVCEDHNTDPGVVSSEIQKAITNKQCVYDTRGKLEPL